MDAALGLSSLGPVVNESLEKFHRGSVSVLLRESHYTVLYHWYLHPVKRQTISQDLPNVLEGLWESGDFIAHMVALP